MHVRSLCVSLIRVSARHTCSSCNKKHSAAAGAKELAHAKAAEKVRVADQEKERAQKEKDMAAEGKQIEI